MGSTAADSLVIICFVEDSQSCGEKRPRGAPLTFQRQGQGWGQAGQGTGNLCSPETRQSAITQHRVHVNYLVNSGVTFQSVSAMSLLLRGYPGAADLPAARTELRPELLCGLLSLVEWHLWDPAASLTTVAWGTLATSVWPLCLSVFIARAVCRCQQQTIPPAPSPPAPR